MEGGKPATRVSASRALDFYDPGTVVGEELGTEWASYVMGEIENLHGGKGLGRMPIMEWGSHTFAASAAMSRGRGEANSVS